MLKGLLTGFAILLCFPVFAGEIKIPTDKRVKNFPSGCCAWCSVENLGNVHGVKELSGLAKKRHERHEEEIKVETIEYIAPYGWVQSTRMEKRGDAPASVARMKEQLDELKIAYKLQDASTQDTAILTEAIDNTLGCAVGMRNWPRAGDYHMVTLTDLTDKKCVFVENRGECEVYEGTREWFDAHWSGFTVVIYPAKK
jgi:hypothetical protein